MGVPFFPLVVPQLYDQFYWAHRVQALGIGSACPQKNKLNTDVLLEGLAECLREETAIRAKEISGKIRTDGAKTSAERLVRAYLIT